MSKAIVLQGDMRNVLRDFPENCIDAVVCDPPYHLSSIVKRFGAKNAAPAKHGTDGAFARASRGFMGKQWDGGDIAFQPDTWREIWYVMKPGAYIVAFSSSRTYGRMQVAIEDAGFVTHPMIGWIFGSGMPKAQRLDAPGTDHLRYGLQALKPALEPIYMGQKPLDGTGTQNWKKWGTGALDIDTSRIHGDDAQGGEYTVKRLKPGATLIKTGGNWRPEEGPEYHGKLKPGRWPANLIHDGSDEVIAAFPSAPGQQRADSGSAARFFYCAKASAKDRAGSRHPTIKPLSLMRYLVRLVTPPGGVVLDPFAGSGTTLQAAQELGYQAIGVEQEAEYVRDIVRRLT